jgi:hypothetical protein
MNDEQIMDELAELLNTRRWCYYIPLTAFVEDRGFRVSVVIEDVDGHYPTGDLDWKARDHKEPWFWGMTYHEAEQTAAEQNAKLGYSERDIVEIINSSILKSFKRRRTRKANP